MPSQGFADWPRGLIQPATNASAVPGVCTSLVLARLGPAVMMPGPAATVPDQLATVPGEAAPMPGQVVTVLGPVATVLGEAVTVPGPVVAMPGMVVAGRDVSPARSFLPPIDWDVSPALSRTACAPATIARVHAKCGLFFSATPNGRSPVAGTCSANAARWPVEHVVRYVVGWPVGWMPRHGVLTSGGAMPRGSAECHRPA